MATAAAFNGKAGFAATGIERSGEYWMRLRRALAEYRRYRMTLDELSALSDRELADLGMFRVDLNAIAWKAAREA